MLRTRPPKEGHKSLLTCSELSGPNRRPKKGFLIAVVFTDTIVSHTGLPPLIDTHTEEEEFLKDRRRLVEIPCPLHCKVPGERPGGQHQGDLVGAPHKKVGQAQNIKERKRESRQFGTKGIGLKELEVRLLRIAESYRLIKKKGERSE
jgi:hypothetical protein